MAQSSIVELISEAISFIGNRDVVGKLYLHLGYPFMQIGIGQVKEEM